ncbi:MAG: hypothetical protein JW742_00040, partial [Candidatus Aminicenantes bacterium]|nr:hypothetical protein [Candidatus Aminicenantes bacterium]
ANTDSEKSAAGVMTLEGKGAEAWDPFTGKAHPLRVGRSGNDIRVAYDLPPAGSLLVCVPDGGTEAPFFGGPSGEWEVYPASGPLRVAAWEPNVLTLDFCDLTMDGRTERDLYFYEAQLRTFRRHGLDRNPWDSAVQFKTNILDRDVFPADSGFEATFRFTIGRAVNLKTLEAVVERPSLFRVAVNGRAVEPQPGRFWLDKAFGVYAVGAHLREGENRLTVTARPFTIHAELEPVYLRGVFRAVAGDRGFRIEAARPIVLGAWSDQGWPFCAGPVAYTKMYRVPKGAPGGRDFALRLGRWRGALGEVRVDDRSLGVILSPPYEIGLGRAMSAGRHRVRVVVYGTLKNPLGPHHGNPPLGAAWPGNFRKAPPGGRAPGAAYDVRPYGLLDDFEVVTRRSR